MMLRGPLPWLIGALVVTAIVLMANNDAGATFGVANGTIASAVMLVAMLAYLVVGGAWRRASGAMTLRNIAIWLAIFAAFGLIYSSSPAVQALMAR